ncbi:hypothetical protein [Streptomyces sp. NPDC051567]|uniref:hypothetical protein n=1 Tax=Streptomyces sp. NPDC051567 TaxID=3365660 RepID=UPI0037B7514F
MVQPPETGAADQAAALIAAVEAAYTPTGTAPVAYRDASPLPLTGPTPPVAQPGRPPMSQRATDASALMLAAGVASVPAGGSAALVLWVLGQVDPLVLAVAGAAPVAALVALAGVISRARQAAGAAPATHHHHYTGPVRQEHTHIATTTRGVIARSTTATQSGG